jgi:hypothetical protein
MLHARILSVAFLRPEPRESFVLRLIPGSVDLSVIQTHRLKKMASQSQSPSKAVITSVGGAIGGGTANSTKPVINGTADAGTIVNIYDGVRLLGSTTVAANGTWSFTPSTDLKGATHSFTAISIDSQGNWGSSSDPMSVVVSATAPAAPVITGLIDSVGAVTGPITNGMTTDDPRPVLNGTGKAGDVIKLFDNGVQIGSATVGADGKWSVKPTADLTKGNHDIYATETSSGGTSGQSAHTTFKFDATVPSKPVINGMTDDSGLPITPGGATADLRPEMSGTGTPGDTITMYDGPKPIGSTTVGPDGKWVVKPTQDLQPGTHDIYVVETSPAGVPSVPSDHTGIVVDTSTPAAPVISNVVDNVGSITGAIAKGGFTDDTRPVINGTAKAGDIIKLYDGSTLIGSVKADTNGKWSIQPANALSNAAHDLSATDTNLAGTVSPASAHFNFTVDTTTPVAPVLTRVSDWKDGWSTYIGEVPSGSVIAYPQVIFAGTGAAGSVLKMYDGSTLLCTVVIKADGTWPNLPLPAFADGFHNITVTQTNAAGTESGRSSPWTFTVDTSTPAAPVISNVVDNVGSITGAIAKGGFTDDTRPVINGTAKAGDIIKLFDGSTLIGSVKAGTDGKWSIQPANPLSNAAHDLTATDTNLAGTVSPASAHFNFTVDTTTPATPSAPTITDNGAWVPPGGTMPDGHPVISNTGKGTSGDVIKVYDNGNLIGSTTIDGSGNWSFKPSTDLSTGTHNITVIETNPAGTSSASSSASTVTVNPIPQEIVTITNLYDDTSGSNVNVPSGGTTRDSTPAVQGTVSSNLLSGESLVVYRDGVKLGNAAVNGKSWSYQDSGVTPGAHTYTARVENTGGNSALSDTYKFTVTPPHAGQWNLGALYAPAPGAQAQTLTVDLSGYDLTAGTIGFTVNGSYSSFWNSHYDGGNNFVYTTDLSFDPRLTEGYNLCYQPDLGSALGWNRIIIAPGAWTSVVRSVSGTGWHDIGSLAVLKSQSLEMVPEADDQVLIALTAEVKDSDSTENHHSTVDSHGVFKGTAGGNETVDLNADPASYFKETTAHIEGAKGGAVDTLHLTGDHQILDLTSLTGKTAAAKISGIEVIDLGGQHNTLKLSLVDVLNLGETDLFQQDGKQQLMVNGKEGDVVDLSNSHIAGLAEGEWQQHGTTQVGGVTYNVYEHSGAHTELLVQQGVQIAVH